MKCDVCGNDKAIGVASTSMPYSCAYCVECARCGADPEIVFECWYNDIGSDCSKMIEGLPDSALTFKDGKYVSYRDWSRARDELPSIAGKEGP